MKKAIFTFIITSFALLGESQEIYRHQFSKVPDTARFEIVQSEMGVRYTFKIDKFNGEVFQLVKSLDEKLVWESMDIDPMAEIILDETLEIFSNLSSEQALKLSEMTAEQRANMTSNQHEEYGFSQDKISKLSIDKVNFQLFLSGSGIKHTYLLHIHSGKTWQMVRDIETDKLFWSLIE